MAGVSITESQNIDLDAIISGGDAFMSRIKELQTAKAQAESALADLQLGRSATQAMADAQASKELATKMLDDARHASEEWEQKGKAKYDELLRSAKEQAEIIVAAAQKRADGLDQQVADARNMLNEWSEKTKAEANSIMAQAVASKVSADKQLADNGVAAKELAVARLELQKAMDETIAKQGELDAKIEAIKAAITK